MKQYPAQKAAEKKNFLRVTQGLHAAMRVLLEQFLFPVQFLSSIDTNPISGKYGANNFIPVQEAAGFAQRIRGAGGDGHVQ